MQMRLQLQKVVEKELFQVDSNYSHIGIFWKNSNLRVTSFFLSSLWTQSKQGSKTLNEWLTYIHNLVEACNYGDSTDRIIRDALIIGCDSHLAKDKIIRRGETITLNEVIEILQTDASTNSTLRQFQEIQSQPVQQVDYVSYERNKKRSRRPSNEQNSSSTGSKRQCSRCGEPYNKKHQEECRTKNAKCDGCGITGHFKKCCKKSGNFPNDNSNRQNQSSSTGPGRMNVATAVPQLDAEFFNERGLPKIYNLPPVQQIGSMNILRKVPTPSNATYISENGVEIQHNIFTSVSDPVPDPVPSPDFPSKDLQPYTSPTDRQHEHPEKSSNSKQCYLHFREWCRKST